MPLTPSYARAIGKSCTAASMPPSPANRPGSLCFGPQPSVLARELFSAITARRSLFLMDRPVAAIHVTISGTRRLPIIRADRAPLIVVHHSARLAQARHPTRLPPRTRIDETTVDLSQSAANLDEALSWLIRACSRRLVTADLLLAAIQIRPKLRWRTELTGTLTEVSDGVHSVLELRYVRGVERAHGLPRAARQAVSRLGRRTRYLDNQYRAFGVAVELDGRAAHPAEARWRDIRRDNASAGSGIVTLRYGWADVTEHPCRVATEVASVLRQRGWTGHLQPCGPQCLAMEARVRGRGGGGRGRLGGTRLWDGGSGSGTGCGRLRPRR
jgi:hypothetical protein